MLQTLRKIPIIDISLLIQFPENYPNTDQITAKQLAEHGNLIDWYQPACCPHRSQLTNMLIQIGGKNKNFTFLLFHINLWLVVS